jgi:glycosyltransferase involved in cell wall biosynthesis
MDGQPFISVIVPAYNAREHLDACLDALLASSYRSREIIVVDDSSTDGTADIARAKGVAVHRTSKRSGPAAARNCGALHAAGEILLFIDADVQVRKETLGHVAERFMEHPEIDALFGSYDSDPYESGFLSQYKNLSHHFVHQQSREEAATFWAGCGAIRKEVFRRAAGFDPDRYPEPSIEDIELGYRLKSIGCRIVLDKTLQVKHLKRWTLTGLLRADILCRALPWATLMLEKGEIPRDLNLQFRSRASACLVGLLILLLALAPFVKQSLYGALALLVLLVVLNLPFCRFMFEKRGPAFAVAAFFMHLLYYFYSGLAFVLCWARNALSEKGRARS